MNHYHQPPTTIIFFFPLNHIITAKQNDATGREGGEGGRWAGEIRVSNKFSHFNDDNNDEDDDNDDSDDADDGDDGDGGMHPYPIPFTSLYTSIGSTTGRSYCSATIFTDRTLQGMHWHASSAFQ
ncbi:unnamed protein product [Brugia pahangi]|uniref:Uncharacterized protein n=1 Tax=Brugia pahangi TaxID=6280 RepID=A0A0N4TLC9_BRUPA|nr:unnamed protein product [Brugia pahangi]